MVKEESNAEEAAFQVGYESPSQFSRDYARMFGAPPRRDVIGVRARVVA
jgi:AraC-like DNA-binding protein